MRSLLFLLFFSASVASLAQSITVANSRQLQKLEDGMKPFALNMIQHPDASNRFSSDSIFIRSLVRALQVPHSFNYPFDSLITVSRIYAPDSSFRIFSWQFTKDDNYFRQRGAIQMRTPDGSLKLFPLLDVSEFTDKPEDSIRSIRNWVGSIYYGIVMKEHNGKKYYTLLGYDDNNLRSTKKWLDVLSFNERGEPVFGGRFFDIPKGYEKEAFAKDRFVMEYKKDGRARMNYDAEMDMIIFDHLISETNESDKKFTLIPDGDYQGFKWENGKWKYIDKVFDFALKDGEAPMPVPLKDDNGNSNEAWLLEQSEKNKQRNNPPITTQAPKQTPPKKHEPNRRSQDTEEY